MKVSRSALPGLEALARSGLVVAGLLVLGVGIGDTVAGRAKIAQYEEVLRRAPLSEPVDPAALFPTASEGRERHDLARTKLAFYHLLLTAGQILSAVGFGVIALGVLRARARAAPGVEAPTDN